MATQSENKMEVLFGLFGVLASLTMLIITVVLTPNFNPLIHAVSSLARGEMKALFSISFTIGGSLSIPFYIYLERELINIKEPIRRMATGVSIFSCVCVALVGIIPESFGLYGDFFGGFHGFVASVSFIGSSIYIVLYSILMLYVPKATMYKGPVFKNYLAYFGFAIGVLLILLLITFGLKVPVMPLFEWMLTICVFSWIILTALQLVSYKFFNIPGMYYKRAQYPEALKRFEDALEVLGTLDMTDEPIAETLKENIEYIKKSMEKKLDK